MNEESSSPAAARATSAATRSAAPGPRARRLGLRQPLLRPPRGRAGRAAHRRRPARTSTALDQLLVVNRIEAVVHFAAPLLRRRIGHEPGEVLHEQPRQHAATCSTAAAGTASASSSSPAPARPTACPTKVPITEDEPQQPINPYGDTKLAVERVLRRLRRRLRLGLRGPALLQRRRRRRRRHASARTTTPETHLIPLVHPGRAGQAAAHRDLRHRLPDARRHLHPRLHPRR